MAVKVRERKKGSGEWWIFIDYQGKRKAKKIGKDKRLALEAAKRIEARLVLGDLGALGEAEEKTEKHIPTLKEYVYGWKDARGTPVLGWIDKHAKIALKRSSWTNYEVMLKRHLLPHLGDQRLDRITPRMVADLMVQKILKGLHSKTVKNIKNCLSSVLAYAHHPDGFIDRNPVLGLRVPKPEGEMPAREPDPFTREERRILEEVYREHFPDHYPLIVTAFRTGLRMGELAGLQWGDIDFHHRTARIQRNVVHGRITTPKTRSGRRDVRLTNQVLTELQKLRKKRKEEALRKGWQSVPEWVFCNEHGNPLDPDNFRKRVWNPAMEKSGLRRRTPHDMRHTYATLRLSKGDPLAEVAKEMGHSSAHITFNTYYKWLPSESRSNIDELDDAVGEATEPSATYPQPKMKKDLAVRAKSLNFLVAGGGFEPPTFGL